MGEPRDNFRRLYRQAVADTEFQKGDRVLYNAQPDELGPDSEAPSGAGTIVEPSDPGFFQEGTFQVRWDDGEVSCWYGWALKKVPLCPFCADRHTGPCPPQG